MQQVKTMLAVPTVVACVLRNYEIPTLAEMNVEKFCGQHCSDCHKQRYTMVEMSCPYSLTARSISNEAFNSPSWFLAELHFNGSCWSRKIWASVPTILLFFIKFMLQMLIAGKTSFSAFRISELVTLSCAWSFRTPVCICTKRPANPANIKMTHNTRRNVELSDENTKWNPWRVV